MKKRIRCPNSDIEDTDVGTNKYSIPANRLVRFVLAAVLLTAIVRSSLGTIGVVGASAFITFLLTRAKCRTMRAWSNEQSAMFLGALVCSVYLEALLSSAEQNAMIAALSALTVEIAFQLLIVIALGAMSGFALGLLSVGDSAK